MRKMCQSQQFVTREPTETSVTPAQTFAGKKLKTIKNVFFSH